MSGVGEHGSRKPGFLRLFKRLLDRSQILGANSHDRATDVGVDELFDAMRIVFDEMKQTQSPGMDSLGGQLTSRHFQIIAHDDVGIKFVFGNIALFGSDALNVVDVRCIRVICGRPV